MLLQSTKFDGSLHYQYPVQLVERSENRLVTWIEAGAPIHSYRGEWLSKMHTLSIFQLGRPYVLHAKWDAAWQPRSLYVDISTGTTWSDEIVRYVDLDLDVILNHNSPAIILDDEDEFAEHRVKWNYPDDLVARCHAAVAEVRQMLETRQRPFTTDLFKWRPGTPMPD